MTSLLRRAPRGVTGAQKAASSPRKPHKPRFRVAVGTGTDRKSHTRTDTQITSARSGAHNFLFSFKESLSCHFRAKKIKPHNHTLNSKLKRRLSREEDSLSSAPPHDTGGPQLQAEDQEIAGHRGAWPSVRTGHPCCACGNEQRGQCAATSRGCGHQNSAATRKVSAFQKQGCPSRCTTMATSRRPSLPGHAAPLPPARPLPSLPHFAGIPPAPPSLLQQAQVLRTRRAHFQLLAWPF